MGTQRYFGFILSTCLPPFNCRFFPHSVLLSFLDLYQTVTQHHLIWADLCWALQVKMTRVKQSLLQQKYVESIPSHCPVSSTLLSATTSPHTALQINCLHTSLCLSDPTWRVPSSLLRIVAPSSPSYGHLNWGSYPVFTLVLLEVQRKSWWPPQSTAMNLTRHSQGHADQETLSMHAEVQEVNDKNQ